MMYDCGTGLYYCSSGAVEEVLKHSILLLIGAVFRPPSTCHSRVFALVVALSHCSRSRPPTVELEYSSRILSCLAVVL
eukprot:9478317-Pyramimonas_sp.AAC.1